MNISIYVCHHNNVDAIQNNKYIQYLLCGAVNNNCSMHNSCRDDTGENISNLNPYFSECTGIYWIWKNDFKSDYIGLLHYRRFLNFSSQSKLTSIPHISQEYVNQLHINDENLSQFCANYDIILPRPSNFGNLSMYEQYKKCVDIKNYDLALKILASEYPALYESTKALNEEHSGYMNNIFIMKKELFNHYCSFLFNILFKLHHQVDYSNYNTYQKRVPAFVAERISSIYFSNLLINKDIKSIELNLVRVADPAHFINAGPLPNDVPLSEKSNLPYTYTQVLSTHHGTFISYDSSYSVLCHRNNFEDVVTCKINADKTKITLMHNGKFLAYSDNFRFYATDREFPLDIILNGDNSISFILGNQFLSARPNGNFDLREKNLQWEKFVFPEQKDINLLYNFHAYKSRLADEPLMLACCCGHLNYGADWFSTDYNQDLDNEIYKLDITTKFPFQNNLFDFIYIEHGLEHVDFPGVMNFCAQAYRCLKYNGILRISSPSLDNWIKYYIMDDDDTDYMTNFAYTHWGPLKQAHEMDIKNSKALVFNNALRNWGHQCLLDFTTYKQILLKTGFTTITKEKNSLSKWPQLQNRERRKDNYSLFETLNIEARK